MRGMKKIMKYIIRDIVRSRFMMFYTISLFAITTGIHYLNRDETKTYITTLNVILYLMPLINIFYTSLHYYNSKEFIETILTYPVKRSQIFLAEYFSLVLALIVSYFAGVILPLMIFSYSVFVFYFMVSGTLLISIFTSISLLCAVIFDERIKGIGLLIGIWLFMSIVYDGLILIMYFIMSDFPLDKISVALISLNPVDLTRLFILIKLDIAAMFGYSGANFVKHFGQVWGVAVSVLIALVWAAVPAVIARRKFLKKDF